MSARESHLVRWHLYVSFLALAIGGLFGPLQALERAGIINLFDVLPLTYYQGLTVHGILTALVWTTFFICGFLIFVTIRSLGRPLVGLRWCWVGFGTMLTGVLLVAIVVLTNQATVLYTFYPPLQAHPLFYIGATLLVVGTWIISAVLFVTYRRWRAENPGARPPLMAFATLITFIIWDIATIGVAIQVLFLLLPWSLGIVSGTDPLLARTLFWYFGHPLVYFWLLPAYISWYSMLPKLAGGKLFSDPLARLAFLLFLVFSVPVGLHHQFTDPGIASGWKVFHTITTYAVAVPSLLTAFTVAASLEIAGRARGGQGLLGWLGSLPWKEPSFAAQALAIILFGLGGISGLVNASYTMNLGVHNTAWVPGHFHLTVGTAVTLTFMGISYWLVPYLTGKRLWSRGVALTQAYLWAVGMMVFSLAMHWGGLAGIPRRADLGIATYSLPSWDIFNVIAGIGGVILFSSGVLFLLNIALTLFLSREPAEVEVPVAEAVSGPEAVPALLKRWGIWVGATVVLVIVAYGPILVNMISAATLNAPGFQVW